MQQLFMSANTQFDGISRFQAETLSRFDGAQIIALVEELMSKDAGADLRPEFYDFQASILEICQDPRDDLEKDRECLDARCESCISAHMFDQRILEHSSQNPYKVNI